MTHEELKAHKDTVWSYAGFIGIHEYEYVGDGSLPVYGTFRRIDNGEIVTGIQVCSCYPTKRKALEAHLAGCQDHHMWATKALKEAQDAVDALNAEDSHHE